MALPTTEAPETQIYFTTHRSGANSVPRVSTVVRGERASRSIVNRTTAFWSIWVVASLILADLGLVPFLNKRVVREVAVSRGSRARLRRPSGARRRRTGRGSLSRQFRGLSRCQTSEKCVMETL